MVVKRTLRPAAAAFGVATGAWLLSRAFLRIFRPRNIPAAVDAGRRFLARRRARILAITAHPDDLELFAAGTLHRLAAAGNEIYVLVVSDGEKGVNRRHLAQTRQNEQQRAAGAVGYREVVFLHRADLRLDRDGGMAQAMREAWRDIRPTVILAFDPEAYLPFIVHTDHLAVGRAAIRAAWDLLGGGGEVYLYATRRPDTVVDIAGEIPVKVRAVKCHRSQLRFGGRPYGMLVRCLARLQAAGSGYRYAESFRRWP